MRPAKMLSRGSLLCFLLLIDIVATLPASGEKHPKKKETPQQLRADYVGRVQEEKLSESTRTTGSLWLPDGDLNDASTDYKARKLNDTVMISVSVQTTAAQEGDIGSSRTFSTTSAVTGLAGKINTGGLNPLLNANSSTSLTGKGTTDSSTTFQTNLMARVVAVLPSGNLVLEAKRNIFLNNQHEDVIVHGVVRPGDIGASNTVPSYALSDLEIEMKGKGIIADSTRPPNAITRALLWLVGF